MPRTYRQRLPVDTGLFTPLQLQPTSLLRWAMSGVAGWTGQHLVPLPKLISAHQMGMVVTGVDLSYLKPFEFWDSAELECETALRFVKNGAFMTNAMECLANDVCVARLRGSCRVINLGGDASLGATPGLLPEGVAQQLGPDELLAIAPDRPLAAALATLEAGTKLGEVAHSVRIHRHQVEVADQWSFIEMAAFGSLGRETLAQASDVAAVRQGISRPLTRLIIEYRKPMFLFDEASLQTRAYAVGDGVGFVHRVESGAGLHATAVELFETEHAR